MQVLPSSLLTCSPLSHRLDAMDGAAAIANAIAAITADTAISTIRCLNALPAAAKFDVCCCCPIVFSSFGSRSEREGLRRAPVRALHPDIDRAWRTQHRAKDAFARETLVVEDAPAMNGRR